MGSLSGRHGVTMTEVSLAWLLTEEELACLEVPYVPHALVGVMAQNTASAAKQPHVWSTGNQMKFRRNLI